MDRNPVLDTALVNLREAAAHDRELTLARGESAALVELLAAAGRDIAALARILGMLEDRRDEARDELRAIQARLHVRPGQTRAPIEWRRGRAGMAGEMLDAAQLLAREAQREEVTPTR